ncbi:MAG: transglutaminase-like domain-containing protein [Pseudomonadota bacterium]|nr:transglutaminase-like domain-containing protein [Pseudomonadota bacterium]
MTLTTVSVTIDHAGGPGGHLLAPVGIPAPDRTPAGFAVAGGSHELVFDQSGQAAALIRPSKAAPLTLTYTFRPGGTCYPEAMFAHRDNRYTRAGEGVASEARRIAGRARDGHAAIGAIVNAVADKFSYGHPEHRFNEGFDEVPHLSCGLTEGSCVDINTYLIASLRAAGFDAGYVTGYFFPAEKNGRCDDMHCWVVTRHHGVVLEWDIAHHMKLGKRPVCCGLNPKPGERVAIGHSMGLDFPELSIADMKLLAEPVWLDSDGKVRPLLPERLAITMHKADMVSAA